jgi:hypothetical protein
VLGDDLYLELVELRRGRGLDSSDLVVRIGPRLRQACGIDGCSTETEAKSLLVTCLTEATAGLPDDLQLAARTALAMPPAPRQRFLRERTAWLAGQLERDARTIARRTDEAFRLLAQTLSGPVPRGTGTTADSEFAPDGWFIDSLVANVVLDRDPPQVIETRRIVAVRAGLDRIAVSFSAPRSADGGADRPLSVNVLHGGELTELSGGRTSHVRGVLQLPHPLTAGEAHEYGIVFSAFPRRWLRPYYVLTPMRRCDHFRLRAKFDRAGAPAKLWRVDGAPPRLLDDFVPGADLLDLDGVGEVCLEFHGLRQGLSYGIQWVNLD